jgi:hypothetical protein
MKRILQYPNMCGGSRGYRFHLLPATDGGVMVVAHITSQFFILRKGLPEMQGGASPSVARARHHPWPFDCGFGATGCVVTSVVGEHISRWHVLGILMGPSAGIALG